MGKKLKYVYAVFIMFFMFQQPVFAANYTPSITYKPSPPIVELDKKQNIPIYDKHGEIVHDIPWGDIVVTPISDIESAKYDDIRQSFHEANNKLAEKPLFELCPDLQILVSKTFPSITEHQLVIKDLFHLAVYGTYKEYLEQPGNHIYLTFKVDIAADDPFYVLFCPDGGDWAVIQPEYVVRNADGTVTIRFDQTGAVAFLTGKSPLSSVDKENPEYTSAQTGYNEFGESGYFLFAGILCILSIGIVQIRMRIKNR